MRCFIHSRRLERASCYAAALLLLIGQGCASSEGSGAAEKTAESTEAIQGPTSFVSAEPFVYVYGEEEEEEEEEELMPEDGLAEDSPTESQGDIYEVLGDGHLLDLNPWRGLQVIDAHDPANPHIVGRLPIAGKPIQMHVQGDRAIIVLNEGVGYQPDAERLAAQGITGAAIVQVDISDRKAPKVVSRTAVPGFIRASLFESGAGGGVLDVGTTEWGYFPVPGTGYSQFRNKTLIRRFDVTAGALVPTSMADITGELRGLARFDGTLVALHSENRSRDATTEVSLVDISPADGALSVRGKVSVSPNVPSLAHVDLRGHVLRVLSGPKWDTAGQACHLQTWDTSAAGNPVPIDQKDFAPGAALHGAKFTDQGAYVFTTLLQASTLHTLSIDPAGHVAAPVASSTPGFANHLRPVLGGSRLLGVGQSATFSYHVSASLYDPNSPADPLLAHVEVTPRSSDYPAPQELSFEPRAFTVLEGAVNVQAPGGQTETGLLLLPYASGDWGNVPYTAGVQLFTFSSDTLTQRGFLALNSLMRRGFATSDSDAAGLSDRELGLYDRSDVDHPTQNGHLFLAPHFAAIFRYGDYRVRVRNPEDTTYWGRPTARARAEVIPRDGEAQHAPVLASIELPPYWSYYKVGNLLTAVRMSNWAEITVTTVDLSDPLHPQARGDFVTKALPALNQLPAIHATHDSLAFVTVDNTQSYVGDYDECTYQPRDYSAPCYGQEGCTYWAGLRVCQAPTGQPLGCDGGFAQCTYHVGADPTCVPLDMEQAQPYIMGGCTTGPAFRDVQHARIGVVDLSNPSNPTVSLAIAPEDEFVGAYSDGEDLYVTLKQLATVAGDARPHAKYFVRRIDLSQPSQPVVGPPINVPGEVVGAKGDKLITRDPVWGDHFMETAVAKLELKDGLAELGNYQRFPDREVRAVVVDDAQRPVVTHGLGWYSIPTSWDPRVRLSLLLPAGGPGVSGFEVRAESLIQAWMTLDKAQKDILFFGVPGGTLTVNADGNHLKALSFFYLQNWSQPESWMAVYPDPIVDGDDVLMADGRWGILQSGRHEVLLPVGP